MTQHYTDGGAIWRPRRGKAIGLGKGRVSSICPECGPVEPAVSTMPLKVPRGRRTGEA